MLRRNFISLLFLTTLPTGGNAPFLLDTAKKVFANGHKVEPDWEKITIDGIIDFEKFRATPYTCSGGQRTIGYGSSGKRSKHLSYVSKDDAMKLLLAEIGDVKDQVNNMVKVPLTSHQFWSLVSFTFNTGPAHLKTLVNGKGRLNEGEYESIPKVMPKYVYAGGRVRRGLVRRREWELKIWKGLHEA